MLPQQYQSCIEACHACADACDVCASSCLKEQDVAMLARCIALDVDCAEICRQAAAYMARGSEFADLLCQACAEICDVCADECAEHSSMSHCQECEQACRRCAQECHSMQRAQAGSQAGAVAAPH